MESAAEMSEGSKSRRGDRLSIGLVRLQVPFPVVVRAQPLVCPVTVTAVSIFQV
jgi:hypothetical protein